MKGGAPLMSTRQLIEDLISDAPENKLAIILAFVQSVLHEDSEINNSLLSEPSLSSDWLCEEQEAAWQDL